MTDDTAALLETYEAGTEGRIEHTYSIDVSDGSYDIDLVYVPGDRSVAPASIDSYLDQLYRDLTEDHDSRAAEAEHLVEDAFTDLRDAIDSPEYLGIRLEASTGRKKYTDNDLYHLDTITRATATETDFLDEEGFQ